MSTSMSASLKNLGLAVLIGAALGYVIQYSNSDDSEQRQKILSLENQIKNTELALAKKQEELINARLIALRQNSKSDLAKANTVTEICKQVKESSTKQDAEQITEDVVPSSLPSLKDLETHSVNDQRSFVEKIDELLSGNPTKEKIAIATKGVFDLAGDRENLSDEALQTLYSNQTDSDLKRVLAQVMSLRGNNSLIENHIAETQSHLKSEQPADRQAALQDLAKTHNVTAVNAIAPFLMDQDINVRLDALLALGATGNENHIKLVEKLTKDPDPAVSMLANEVMSNLKNLSSSARTSISSSDIAVELPITE